MCISTLLSASQNPGLGAKLSLYVHTHTFEHVDMRHGLRSHYVCSFQLIIMGKWTFILKTRCTQMEEYPILCPETEGFYLTVQNVLKSSTSFPVSPALHLLVRLGFHLSSRAPRGSCTRIISIGKCVGGLFVSPQTKLQGLSPNVWLAEVSYRENPL